MNEEEYKRGYSDGFRDGFNQAKPKYPYWPSHPEYRSLNNTTKNSCSVCGMSSTDALGNLQPMGYVCPNAKCPGKISFSWIQNTP